MDNRFGPDNSNDDILKKLNKERENKAMMYIVKVGSVIVLNIALLLMCLRFYDFQLWIIFNIYSLLFKVFGSLNEHGRK